MLVCIFYIRMLYYINPVEWASVILSALYLKYILQLQRLYINLIWSNYGNLKCFLLLFRKLRKIHLVFSCCKEGSYGIIFGVERN